MGRFKRLDVFIVSFGARMIRQRHEGMYIHQFLITVLLDV